MSKLPQIAQEFFDDNRERFDAETTTAPASVDKHIHTLYQRSGSDFGCRGCTSGWTDTSGTLLSLIK